MNLIQEAIEAAATQDVCGNHNNADLLRRLAREVERMGEVLRPFADFARADSFDRLPDETPMTQGSRLARKQVTAGDFKRALAAHAKRREAGE